MTTIENSVCDAVSEAWPDATVQNPDQIGFDPLHVLVTLCPLYGQDAPGQGLESSQLMPSAAASIAESRVGNKWVAVQRVLGALAVHAEEQDIPFKVTAVFANKGVLLGGYDDSASVHNENVERLDQHESVYRQAFAALCEAHDTASQTFTTYSELAVPLPTFVNPNSPIPIEYDREFTSATAKVISALNHACKQAGIPTELTPSQAKGKIRSLVSAFGPETAYWLTLGYLAFDYQIPALVGEHGIAVYTERFAPLLSIGKLTPGVASMARIGVPA